MSADRGKAIVVLLGEVLALPPERRDAYVDEVCGGDAELKAELQRLVKSADDAEEVGFFEELGKRVKEVVQPPEALEPGESFGQYVVEGVVGRGGMGIVYRARDTRLQRTVALKFLTGSFVTFGEGRQRFLNEARAAAALDHPNICTIYEISERAGTPFIAMSYVVGKSLKEVEADGPLEMAESLRLGMQICEGLQAAHAKGIIHRDIKPANLMINDQGRLVITDFGIAKLPGTDDLSKSGTTRGTVAYMSPEQALGKEVDPRSDLWSLGVVLYEMLTRNRPFEGRSEYEVIQAILNAEPRSIESIRGDVPRELRSLIYKLLAKKPRDRYIGAHDVLVELRAIDSTMRLRQEMTRAAQALPSIAVLPFVNMSADPENDYFCEGLAEELINDLANVSGLRVVARTSSFAFKSQSLNVQDIGRKLQVEHILEGSVRKAGNQVRIVAQLVSAEDGYHVWSQRYDRVLDDVFAVQDEIALGIVGVLRVKLLGNQKAGILKPTTSNPIAFERYLKARFHWNRRTQQDLEQAIQFAEQALQEDPAYANAYSCLADSYVLSGLYGYRRGADVYPLARAAAERAIQLDPLLAEAYTSQGASRAFDWDWNGAERSCRKAISLNPGYPTGHSFFAGFILAAQGRFEEAINEIAIAGHYDPLSFVIQAASGIIHWQARQYEKAFEIASRVIEANPRFWLAYALRGLVYEQWEQYDQAILAFQRAIELAGSRSSTLGLGMLGHALACAGRTEEAEKVLDLWGDDGEGRYASPYDRAVICLGLQRFDEALDGLRMAVEDRSSWIVLADVDPRFSALRGDPAFAAIRDSMWMSA
ncbi:MAG: protein kinase [Rhodothermales bacterium]